MQDFDDQKEKSFAEWHELENRGDFIGFQQGTIHILRNHLKGAGGQKMLIFAYF